MQLLLIAIVLMIILSNQDITFGANFGLRLGQSNASNPVLPGYFADPSVVEHDGRFYIYATIDPWGADTLGCWESTDFKNWTYRNLNWPTKKACTSAKSWGAKVWAPSVIQGADGKFYMYVSVGSEVWAGQADHPLGPWKSMLPDGQPLIPVDYKPNFHMIDAEIFIDDDDVPYLYWGSGLNWVNGKCFVVRLKKDMHTFDSDVMDITPTNYFEAPFMIKRNGRYYLMYSSGNTTLDTYQVHYAIGENPFGPFTEGKNSPILKTDKSLGVVSPGHHAVFTWDKQDYIVYHTAAYPTPGQTLRQVCVDKMEFDKDGTILPVVPTLDGAALLQKQIAASRKLTDKTKRLEATASSSSEYDTNYSADKVLDGNYTSRWMAGKNAVGPHWLQLDTKAEQNIHQVAIRFEYAHKLYKFTLEGSADGLKWTTIKDASAEGLSGSPIVLDVGRAYRYVRISFAKDTKPKDASIWEVQVIGSKP